VEKNRRICSRCIMDDTDPEIQFDEQGVCHHCKKYDRMAQSFPTGSRAEQTLERMVEDIKRQGKDKAYDCIIGVSGGVDSTYVGLRVKAFGLRPLAVHLDNGWDSELAVSNIQKTLEKLNIELYTHVIDWEEFKDLQLSFLKASTPDSEIPSDHAIVSLMRRMARKFGNIPILPGSNYRTESHLPLAWSQGHMDWKYIRSVHALYGKVELRTFPHMDFWTYHRYYFTQTWINILDYLDYRKGKAIDALERELGWKYYGGKHYESVYTRFYQGYILLKKFGYDKRKSHLSSMICAGEITREEALEELKEQPYPVEMQEDDKGYTLKKLGITAEDFEGIMNLPKKTYWDYPSYGDLYNNPIYRGLRSVYKLIR